MLEEAETHAEERAVQFVHNISDVSYLPDTSALISEKVYDGELHFIIKWREASYQVYTNS